jgi:PAS domain S-box-containing protein
VPLRHEASLERLEPLRALSLKPWIGYTTAIVSVALAIAARFAFGDAFSVGTFITFYPAVIATAAVGRLLPGLLSIALSMLAADYFLIPPVYSLALSSPRALALVFFGLNLTLIVAVIALLHKALDILWRQERNLRFVLETAPVGLLTVDRDGTITLVNEAIERQFGYRRDELIGKQVDVLLPERFRFAHRTWRENFMKAPVARAMGAGRDLHGVRHDGTEIPVEIGLKPIQREGLAGALATVLDISERKEAERRQLALVHEVQHRARNLLAVVQALAARTFTPERTAAEARQLFMSNLAALARAQELFATRESVSLRDIVEREVRAFHNQIEIDGCAILFTPRAAQNFSLIIHELCTNSVKHGALAMAGGKVVVSGLSDGDDLVFVWVERDGPLVQEPRRKGFGQAILADFAGAFARSVELKYPAAGFAYTLRVSSDAVSQPPGETSLVA